MPRFTGQTKQGKMSIQGVPQHIGREFTYEARQVSKQGSRFYHWAFKTKVAYLDSERMNESTMQHLCGLTDPNVRANNLSFTLNGGVYVSENPYEWSDYGDKLVVIELTEDVWMLDVKSMMGQLKGHPITVSAFIEKISFAQLKQESISIIQHSDCINEFTVINHTIFKFTTLTPRDFDQNNNLVWRDEREKQALIDQTRQKAVFPMTIKGVGKEIFTYDVKILPKGTRFYHWTSRDTAAHYRQKIMTREEMEQEIEERKNATKKDSVLYGGLYVSKNPYDWCDFQGCNSVVVVELTQDVKMLKVESMMTQLDGYEISVAAFIQKIGYTQLREHCISVVTHSDHYGEFSIIDAERIRFTSIDTTKDLTVTELADMKTTLPSARAINFACSDHYHWLRANTFEEKCYLIMKTYQMISENKRQYFDLIQAFEFIDWFDLLYAVAEGNQTPWNCYGAAFVKNWKAVEPLRRDFLWAKGELGRKNGCVLFGDDSKISDTGDPNSNSEILEIKSPAELRKYCFGRLQKLFDAELRDGSKEIIAGGGVGRDGYALSPNVITVNGDYYFRATTDQITTLRNNHFIRIVEEITINRSVYGADHLLKYRYIDKRDFNELKEKFDCLKVLGNDYESVKHKDITEPESKKFTQRMLGVLINFILEDDHISELQRYQLLISLHALNDCNGRICRAFYKVMTGTPLLMVNWDFDLLFNEGQLKEYVERCEYIWLKNAERLLFFAKTQQSIDFNIIDVVAFCNVILGRETGNEVNHNNIKGWIAETKLLREKKLYFDMLEKLEQMLQAAWQKNIKQVSFANSNSSPIFNNGNNNNVQRLQANAASKSTICTLV